MIANTPVLATAIIIPAIITPRITAFVVSLKPMFKKDAANVPVQAPVPGSGIPTNNISAINKPLLPAFSVNF